MNLDTALIERAVPAGSMRYYAWLYTPEAHRDAIAALFLIETELHDSARAPHEVAHVRLQWWREEIDRLIAGKAQHPATRVLQSHAHPQRDFAPLHETVLSAAQELANATYETDIELDRYLRGRLGVLATLAVQQLAEATTPPMLEAADQLGRFIRRTEVMRDLRRDFHHGRLYLPLAELDAIDIEYEALQRDEWPDTFVQLLRSRGQRQLTDLQVLKQGMLSNEKQILRPLLVLADLHARVLHSVVSDPLNATRQRVELGPLRKLWTAWSAARAAR